MHAVLSWYQSHILVFNVSLDFFISLVLVKFHVALLTMILRTSQNYGIYMSLQRVAWCTLVAYIT